MVKAPAPARYTVVLRWIGVIAFLFGVGCGEAASPPAADRLATAAQSTVASPVGTGRSFELSIDPHPGVTVRGTARVEVKSSGSYAITVKLTGLAPGADQIVNCIPEPARVRTPEF